MIEGGGLGVFRPEEVGPDRRAGAERRGRHRGRRRGRGGRASRSSTCRTSRAASPTGTCADQRLLRRVIPENRLRVYDVRAVIETLADTGSVLELRRGFGLRHGHRARPHRGPADRRRSPTTRCTSPARSTATAPTRPRASCSSATPSTSRCCSCATRPGIMVGPGGREDGAGAPLLPAVRHRRQPHACRSSRSCCARRYGLGAQAMAGGSFKAPLFTVAWPTGEFGGMGLEGAVKLGYRNELAAIDDPAERKRAVRRDGRARRTSSGKALNTASLLRDRRRDRPGRLARADHGRAALVPARRRGEGRSGRAWTRGKEAP